MEPLDRRAFLHDAALLTAALAWPWKRAPAGGASDLRVGFVPGTGARAAARRNGVTLGVEEAMHAAAMFGGSIKLTTLAAPGDNLSALSAVIGEGDETSIARAKQARIPYMNIGNAADALRGAQCGAQLFHVALSDAMLRDALSLTNATGARVEAWDASLDRFGADTLNQRYSTRFHEAMTSDAWLGWFAVKALWEASLRARSADASALAAYLTRDGSQFDGHKGRPLSFRQWDRQLRQPVYVLNGESIVECPPSPKGDETARESLDRIGTSRSATECRA